MLSLSLALISALLLGFYDVVKKESLNINAVLPTLFFATLAGAVIFSLCLAGTWLFPLSMKTAHLFVPQVSLQAHLMFIIKTVIVFIAWVTAYFAMKNLPLTITSPIRCSNPLWTLFGAIIIFHEKMTLYQWGGLILTIIFYYFFSLSGKKEGLSFRTNKWVLLMIISTIIGAVSSLYDKYLVMHYDRVAMQTWYTIYMVPLSGAAMMLFWYRDPGLRFAFKWRWTIPMIGILLAAADYIYFWSIDFPGSLIALISTLRRGSVIVAFVYGAIVFKEKNILQKAFAVAGILAGIAMIILGK